MLKKQEEMEMQNGPMMLSEAWRQFNREVPMRFEKPEEKEAKHWPYDPGYGPRAPWNPLNPFAPKFVW